MRRSICYCEPQVAIAGEVGTWQFIFTPSTALPKGTLLKFDLGSKGRSIDWQIPQADLKKKDNVVYLTLPNKKIIQAKEVEIPQSFVPQFEFKLPTDIQPQASLIITVGASPEAKSTKYGNRAQYNIQRRKPFYLYVDTTGKGNYQEAETFVLDIKGNELDTIRVLAPSVVTKNKRFDVVLRFEDKYGNLTNNAPQDTLIEVSHQNLRENLKWTLFIPETGFLTLPNLYFNDIGIYTIELLNKQSGERFKSGPIKCFSQETKSLFWGMLHGESERTDSTENIDSCLRHFRDEKSIHFFASSPFEWQQETSTETWKHICQHIDEFNEEDRFVTFHGFQWVGEPKSEGIHHIIFNKNEKSLLRQKEQRSSTLKKLYKIFSPKELLSIPTFTNAKGYEYNFEEFNPEFERVVEIYNAWGSSEYSKEDGNNRVIHSNSKKGSTASKEGLIINALLENKRFGFVAGGLDDRGIYSDFFEAEQEQYSPGLTGIYAEQFSRNTFFEALYNRNCYATTGERIILGLFLAQAPMGSELDATKKPGLSVNRYITGFVAGTDTLTTVELIRNGKVFKTFKPKSSELEFEIDDMDSVQDIVLTSEKHSPFIFYYLRVMQADGHMAWSSPIWVDFPNTANSIAKNSIKKTTVAKPAPKTTKKS